MYHNFPSITKTIPLPARSVGESKEHHHSFGTQRFLPMRERWITNLFLFFTGRSLGRDGIRGIGRKSISTPSLPEILMDPRCGAAADDDDGEFLPISSSSPDWISFISDPMERAMTRVIRKRVPLPPDWRIPLAVSRCIPWPFPFVALYPLKPFGSRGTFTRNLFTHSAEPPKGDRTAFTDMGCKVCPRLREY